MTSPESERELASHYEHCGRLLHEADRDCWLACLFAPSEARPHLHAVYAFAHEIGSVRDKVSQPLLGEMRLRWWLDALESADETGGARAHPVADAFFDTIQRQAIPRAEAVDFVEAHGFDLYGEPTESVETLEAHCARTASPPMRWSARIMGSSNADQARREALENAAIALGLTKALLRLPKQIALGQTFIPNTLAERHGANEDDSRRGIVTPQIRAALAELRERARMRYEAARRAARGQRPAQPALLPAALVPLYLEALGKEQHDPFHAAIEPPQWRRQWRLWRASRADGL